MQDLPQPVSGPELVRLRKQYGVSQKDLAEALGVHRTNLNRWEAAEPLDAIRSARYQAAIRRLVQRAVA